MVLIQLSKLKLLEKIAMKSMWKKIFFGTAIVIFVVLGTIVYLSQFHIDLSLKYKDIEGYEDIVFKDSWNEQCFCLCIWGLKRTESSSEFQDNRNYDSSSFEYMTLIEKTDVQDVNLEQVVLSPDENYILYVERIYRGTGVTDDEDVYYKVYSINDDKVIEIFSGYKQFLLVDWVEK